MRDGETLVVVTDANVLINLVHAELIWLLGRLSPYRFAAPPKVIAVAIRAPCSRRSTQVI